MVLKKTSRSPKSAAPAQPPEVTKPTPSLAASAPKVTRRTPKKAPAAAEPASRAVTRRKRQAKVTPPQPEATQPAVTVSDNDIRMRAYFLSLDYRGSGRKDVDFWLLAERELRPAKTPLT